MKKSLSIKIPYRTMLKLEKDGNFTPRYLSNFIEEHLDQEINTKDSLELCHSYTLKIDPDLHKSIKLKAIEHNLPINEFIARLLRKY